MILTVVLFTTMIGLIIANPLAANEVLASKTIPNLLNVIRETQLNADTKARYLRASEVNKKLIDDNVIASTTKRTDNGNQKKPPSKPFTTTRIPTTAFTYTTRRFTYIPFTTRPTTTPTPRPTTRPPPAYTYPPTTPRPIQPAVLCSLCGGMGK